MNFLIPTVVPIAVVAVVAASAPVVAVVAVVAAVAAKIRTVGGRRFQVDIVCHH
jgi:hypothetical protein